MQFASTFISVAFCATYYTIQLKGNENMTLCLSGSVAGFREITRVEELRDECKLFWGKKQFKSMDGRFLCVDPNKGTFKGCITKSAPHSNMEILNSSDSIVVKQDNQALTKGVFDEDISGYVAMAQEKPTGDVEKLLVVMRDLDTGEVVPTEAGALPENMIYSTLI